MSGCKPSYDVVTTRLPEAAPYSTGDQRAAGSVRWHTGDFPLSLKIDSTLPSYYDGSTLSSHGPEVMAARWDNVLAGANLFNYSFGATTNSSSNISDYDDGEFGLYGINPWFSDVSGNALAVTQYFAVRKNAGQSNEYLQIIEADILVNLEFDFSDIPNSSQYDLSSVILHELGHLLGLGHYTGSENSVMEKYLYMGQTKRSLYAIDRTTLEANYPSIVESGATAAQAPSAPPAEGEEIIRGIIEQRADGTCKHYIID